MDWSEFAKASPELAGLGQERFDKWGLCLVGTIRRDGTPRISPVEPLVAHGSLYLGMMWRSKKALDLLRDPRCLVHSIISDKAGTEGEFKVRGPAVEISDLDERERYCQALYEKIKWRPEEPEFHLFALDIESAAFVRFENDDKKVTVWP